MTSRPSSLAWHHLTRGVAAAVAAAVASLLLPIAGLFIATAVLTPIAIADSRIAANRRKNRRTRPATVGAGTAVGPVTPGRKYRAKLR